MDRVNVLRQKGFAKKKLDGFIAFNSANVLYLTGASGASCLLVPPDGKSTVYVYSVNYEDTKIEAKGFNVELVKRGEDLTQKVASEIKALKIKKLAYDTLTFESHRSLAKALRGNIRIRTQGDLVWELRKTKDPNEIKAMRKAAQITSRGMKAAYETIRPGVREYEVAAEIEYAMRKMGSWGTAFDTSVASGARSAFPHGGCTDHEIRRGDLVVIDIGAKYRNYCSDMTRTIVAGKASEKQKKLYETVKLAQKKASEIIAPNVEAKKVDLAARETIDAASFGEYFVHGLGHGVGLEIHEPPTLNSQSKDRLAVGHVVTNEPGIYLVGFGGVRIEDSVLVQKDGGENLTECPYTLETAS